MTLNEILSQVPDLNESQDQMPYDNSVRFTQGNIGFDWDMSKKALAEQKRETKIAIMILLGKSSSLEIDKKEVEETVITKNQG